MATPAAATTPTNNPPAEISPNPSVTLPSQDPSLHAAAITANVDPQQASTAAAAKAAQTKRNSVLVTLSSEAHQHYEALAKREHRSLPNYLFVKLQKAFEAESGSADAGE